MLIRPQSTQIRRVTGMFSGEYANTPLGDNYTNGGTKQKHVSLEEAWFCFFSLSNLQK